MSDTYLYRKYLNDLKKINEKRQEEYADMIVQTLKEKERIRADWTKECEERQKVRDKRLDEYNAYYELPWYRRVFLPIPSMFDDYSIEDFMPPMSGIQIDIPPFKLIKPSYEGFMQWRVERDV